MDNKYDSFAVAENSDVVALAKAACAMHGFTPDITVTGGGSDANFLNAYGLPSVILALAWLMCILLTNTLRKRICIIPR